MSKEIFEKSPSNIVRQWIITTLRDRGVLTLAEIREKGHGMGLADNTASVIVHSLDDWKVKRDAGFGLGTTFYKGFALYHREDLAQESEESEGMKAAKKRIDEQIVEREKKSHDGSGSW